MRIGIIMALLSTLVWADTVMLDALQIEEAAVRSGSYLLSGEEALQTRSITLQERLEREVSFSRVNDVKGEGAVSFRGVDFRATDYVQDGIPLYRSVNGFVDTKFVMSSADLSLNDGSAPTSMGVAPMGGEVQVNSKAPQKSLQSSINTTISSNDEYYQASLGGRGERLYFQADLGYYHRSDFRLSSEYEATPVQPKGKRSNSDKEQYDISLKSGIYLNEKTHLAAKLSLSRSQYGLPANVYTDTQNPVWDAYSRVDKKDLNSFYLYGDYKEKAYELSLRGYYDEYRDIWSIYDDALYSSVQPKTTYDDTRLGAIAKASMTQESHKETLLFQAEQNVHNRQGGAMPNAEFQADTLKASYLHEWALSEALKIEGGLSYTKLQAKKESDAGALNPAEDKEALDAQAKLSHTDEEGTLYASISKKSRMPSMVEMFTFFPFPWITANPGLKPERSLQYSSGYQQMLGETSLLDLSLYYYDIRDLIVSSNMSYSNREKAEHYGAELRMESEAYDRHQLRLSYAYAHTRDSEGNALVLIPEHRVKLEDTLAISKAWKGYLSYQYLGAHYSTNTATYSDELKRLGICHLLEAQALYEISAQTKLRFGIKNLLDEACEWKYGYPTQGRSYYVSLQSVF